MDNHQIYNELKEGDPENDGLKDFRTPVGEKDNIQYFNNRERTYVEEKQYKNSGLTKQ